LLTKISYKEESVGEGRTCRNRQQKLPVTELRHKQIKTSNQLLYVTFKELKEVIHEEKQGMQGIRTISILLSILIFYNRNSKIEKHTN
jgi:hypothetical protein